MSRVTAPVAKLSRALSSSAARAANPLLDASTYNAGAVLMPKYAELLRNRRSTIELSESRTLTTTHRPTPQPSIANRAKPLMQTFSSSASSATPSSHLDAAVLPGLASLSSSTSFADVLPRMPLLPDNYAAAHPAPAADLPVSIASSSIVAVNPDTVLPATPLSSLSGVLDTIELKFVHEEPAAVAQDEGQSQGMIRDLWKGMVEDVFGSNQPIRKSN
ncbi:hypothetical protein N5P37_005346 [Trichoderma harzianum]|uniref:Uncharacterized protein n=1 Tax=Trichoderma harzianum CBS 226.95 TaxID=983964 RepID=A0A2T4ACC3_TRIHA|nr:hypothetical protein M431DRAFT_85810 [Trichoderma harzianum CBS 226.95]KAK0762529.1 hypothetical protein N5P37_005346 [Trichoderma harzianum]PKK41590.1 hypothetical protein CI102_13463 [Trichoderma harzianum]PTB54682.1 hypothetical protein M431DRAFT_85810 [Trichoderma harzianum CBS 226.95]